MRLLNHPIVTDQITKSGNKARSSFGPASKNDWAKSAEIEPKRLRDRLTFVEDFTLEHSLPGRQIKLSEIVGDCESRSH